jgi:hypothetical protein
VIGTVARLALTSASARRRGSGSTATTEVTVGG